MMKTLQLVLYSIILTILFIGCSEFDERGFNTKTKIHSETKTLFDKIGFDYDGYNKDGFDIHGLDRNGWYSTGKNNETNEIFDKQGFDKNGWSVDGINRETNSKFNKYGYDINNIDKNGNPDLSKFRDRNSDDVSKICNEIVDLEIPDTVKGEFETTEEFMTRKINAVSKNSKLKEYYSKKKFIGSTSGNCVYNADEKAWIFSIFNIYTSNLINVEKYLAKNGYGETFEVEAKSWENTIVLFSDSYEDNNNFRIETVKVPMEIDKAKSNNGFIVQILYKLKSIDRSSLYFYNERHSPTLDSPYDIKEKREGVFAKYCGVIVWDNEKKNALFFDIVDK